MRNFDALTDRERRSTDVDDGALIARVRSGDNEAFGVLFDRHHAAAVRMARRVAPSAETDDLVSESFLQMLLQLQNGAGPDLAFRAYLFTSIRNLATKYARARDRIRPIDDEMSVEPDGDLADLALAEADNTIVRNAFGSLPERWQRVLWHLEVEREKPRDIAVTLGMKPNSVSALAHRARAGLRDQYLQQHLKLPADTASIDCRYVRSHLTAYVRSASVRRDCARITRHLAECGDCAQVHAEIADVDSRLGNVLLAHAAAYAPQR